MITFSCPSCGNTIAAEVAPGSAVTCPLCRQVVTVPAAGAPMAAPPVRSGGTMGMSPPVRKGLAVASLVLGILGLLTSCLPVLALVALILGIVALVNAKRRPAEYGGKGMAIAGILLGAVSLLVLPLLLTVVLPRFQHFAEFGGRAICQANFAEIDKALRQYVRQYDGQPADVEALVQTGLAKPEQFFCPARHGWNFGLVANQRYVAGQPIPPALDEIIHSCYEYIARQQPDAGANNVMMFEKSECHAGKGANVLFADGRVEWIEPYAKVEELVAQTKARLERPGKVEAEPVP